jgi:hypothetical protein
MDPERQSVWVDAPSMTPRALATESPRPQHPGIREQNVIPFVGVIDKIVNSWHGVLTQHTIPPGLLLKVNFPIAPFHTEDVVAHVDYKAIASRFLAFS